MVFKSVVRRWICRFNTWITKTLHLLWLIFRPCKFHRSICSWLWSMCGWCIKPQAAQSSSSGSASTIACAYTGKRKSEVDSCNVIILSNYNYYTVDERDFLGHFFVTYVHMTWPCDASWFHSTKLWNIHKPNISCFTQTGVLHWVQGELNSTSNDWTIQNS